MSDYPFKLSASALSTYLKSPKSFYWRYIKQLEYINNSTANFDHDKLCGIIWAEFTDRFYKGVAKKKNLDITRDKWYEDTDGWVPPKTQDRLAEALESWGNQYYNTFAPDDGCRTAEQSELKLENDKFLGYLDGLSADGVIHEVKSTSRSPILAGQVWKVQTSIQVKLYAVLAQAKGVCVEFAFKDKPHQLYRADIIKFTKKQLKTWEQELNSLADHIYSLGDDEANYTCNPDGCCIFSKNFASECVYSTLCTYGLTKETKIAYRPKKRREETNVNRSR